MPKPSLDKGVEVRMDKWMDQTHGLKKRNGEDVVIGVISSEDERRKSGF